MSKCLLVLCLLLLFPTVFISAQNVFEEVEAITSETSDNIIFITSIQVMEIIFEDYVYNFMVKGRTKFYIEHSIENREEEINLGYRDLAFLIEAIGDRYMVQLKDLGFSPLDSLQILYASAGMVNKYAIGFHEGLLDTYNVNN